MSLSRHPSAGRYAAGVPAGRSDEPHDRARGRISRSARLSGLDNGPGFPQPASGGRGISAAVACLQQVVEIP